MSVGSGLSQQLFKKSRHAGVVVKYKTAFSTQGLWKSDEAGGYAIDERLLLFLRDGQPVLSCPLANVAYWHVEETASPIRLCRKLERS